MALGRTARWVDDRLGVARMVRSGLNKIFPDHWSFMMGEIALYSFIVLVLTGTFLAFFFDPSHKEVVYHGSYEPLEGVKMSEAYASTVALSFDVRAGMVMRQIHHWAALVFVAAIVVHASRIFFTGAFRRPREINWMIGVTLLILAIANGFAGYSLPDDLLSGTGLRIAWSIILSVPVVGTWMAFLLFGGEFPGDQIIGRLFVFHVYLIPALIAGLLAAHLGILWRQKHTQFPGRGRTDGNVVGSHLWPTYTLRSLGLFAGVFAVLSALGGLIQINPIWLYGPFHVEKVSTAAQPDWYVGWLEGALRIFPPWRLELGDYTVSEVFFPGVLLPILLFGGMYAWPFLEARFTGDRREHQLLDRPRDRPVRTAVGVGALTFLVILTIAGGQDVVAHKLDVAVIPVTWTLRVLAVIAPIAAGVLTWKVCHDLQGAEPLAEWAQGGEAPVGPHELPAEEAAARQLGRRPRDVMLDDEPAGGATRRWLRSARNVAVGAGAGAAATLAAFVAGRRRSRR